jgi:starch synthase
VNGLDLAVWDPAGDPALPTAFGDADVAAGKAAARKALAAEIRLGHSDRPVAGMVSRLAEQKGADVVAATVDEIIDLGFDVVILGTGERRYEETLQAAETAHPGRVRVLRRFDERLAHLIYAGSAVFLMPSRYEPCGLGQMIAMRYGTLPIVSAIAERDGTGIVVADLSPTSFVAALARARAALDDPARLQEIRESGMSRDFSWDASAKAYEALYAGLAD